MVMGALLMPTLNPVGHQSTNWMDLLQLKGQKGTLVIGELLNPVGHQSTNWMDLLVITSIFFNPNPRGKRPKRDAGHRGAVEPCGTPVHKLDGPLGYYQKQLFYFIKRPLAIVHIVSYCF